MGGIRLNNDTITLGTTTFSAGTHEKVVVPQVAGKRSGSPPPDSLPTSAEATVDKTLAVRNMACVRYTTNPDIINKQTDITSDTAGFQGRPGPGAASVPC